MISLEIKCPKLSKPEVTTARNQNSIGDRTEKKNIGRDQALSGGQFPSGQTRFSLTHKGDLGTAAERARVLWNVEGVQRGFSGVRKSPFDVYLWFS